MTKKYFTIKAEGIVPVELTYNIMAEDEEEALFLFEKHKRVPVATKTKINGFKKTKATVYRQGTSNILKTKTYAAK